MLFANQLVFVVPALVPVTRTVTHLPFWVEVNLNVFLVAPVMDLHLVEMDEAALFTSLEQAYH